MLEGRALRFLGRPTSSTLCCLPGNDLRQEFQDVGGQSAEVLGQAHEARGQGDGLPMQQHLVGSANGGAHPRVGQPEPCFGNVLHPFLRTTNIMAISDAILHTLMAALTPVLASPKPVLATFFTPSYTQRDQAATSFVL
jgi:hypothetical protein